MAAPTGPESAAPQRAVAGRYLLDRPLGRGGMGTVWLAHDQVLDRPVAVKEVTYPAVVSEEERNLLEQRTMREARAAARLSSPRTTTVHDVVAEEGRPWIVMEYVESRTLGEVLSTSGPMAPAEVARIGLDLLDALEAAHAVDVVHRDVKPGNVLLDAEGRACLTDFGIATSVGDNTLSEQGVLVGSPSYMSPERARGEEAGPFTDLWSLGATLYVAVEGTGPFDRDEAMATLLAVTTEPPRPPERAGPLGPVLLQLMVKEPEQRMTGWQARDALRSALEETARPMSPPPSVAPPRVPPAPGPSGDDPVERIDRQEIKRMASLAGRSFAKGAARAAVAGLNAWQEQAAKHPTDASRPSSTSPSRARSTRSAAQPESRERSRPPASERPPGPGTPAPPRGDGQVRTRHFLRWTRVLLGLVAAGLVLGVALIVVLIVVAVG